MTEESKMQHLGFIQNIITRMNTNSFQVKGMAIAIVSALLAIYASTTNVAFVFLGIVPTILFLFCDSYILLQERKFRGVYNDVAGLTKEIEVRPYEMPIDKYTKKVDRQYSYCNILFSKTMTIYWTVAFLLLFAGLILKFKDCIIINCK